MILFNYGHEAPIETTERPTSLARATRRDDDADDDAGDEAVLLVDSSSSSRVANGNETTDIHVR